MASITRSTKLPGTLAAAAELRAKALGYPSWNAYLKGLIRYDLLVQGPHDATLPLATADTSKQDAVDSKLLQLTQKGIGQRGQLLKRIVERAQAKGGHQNLMDSLLDEANDSTKEKIKKGTTTTS